MKSYLLYGKKEVRFYEIPYPETDSNEVVVKVLAIGICGSDINYYKGAKLVISYQNNHLLWVMRFL